MVDFRKVSKDNFAYTIGWNILRFWHNNIFYRKFVVTGLENIPNTPIIISPNHQNALMDALAIIWARKHQPVFLARSDIFSSDFISKFLVFVRILPVYRIRDGKEKLAQNEEIFNLSIEVLRSKKRPLTIFPEAQHTKFRSLLKLKKGLTRVALLAEKKTNFNLNLHIIPTGIYYSDYFHFRTMLLVNLGEPIRVADYKKYFEESEQKGFAKLRDVLRERMIPLAIHIEHKEFYDEYESARDIFDEIVAEKENLNIKKPEQKFKADKKIIAKLDDFYDDDKENFKNFAEKIKNYSEELKKSKIHDNVLAKSWSKLKLFFFFLFAVILLPFNWLSFLNFAIPVCLPELIVKTFEDTQFHSSIRFVASAVFVSLWGLIGFILLWIFVKIWWIKWIFLLIQPLWLIGWMEFRRFLRKFAGQWRFAMKKQTAEKLRKLRTELLETFKKIY